MNKDTNEFNQKLQKLQKEFLEKKAWKLKEHEQVMYDFVMQSKKSTSFIINGLHIELKRGNKDFGFMHILLRHYCPNEKCNGKLEAQDILRMVNVVKNGIEIDSKTHKNRSVYIQNKNKKKFSVVIQHKYCNKAIFTFFSCEDKEVETGQAI